jgi:hypothetical protein
MVLTLTSAGYQEQIDRGSDKLQFQGVSLNLTADESIFRSKILQLNSQHHQSENRSIDDSHPSKMYQSVV